MSIDMSQFHQVFFDETDEHLATMESVLLAVDLSLPDSEDLNAIFRAAHSIKGGAATFGFADLAELTHILENLLDKVRKGSMALTSDMVDACLQSKDVLTGMLAAHRGAAAVEPGIIAAVEQRLSLLVDGGPAVPADAVTAPQTEVATAAVSSHTLYIELDDLLGVDYPALLQSLSTLGEMTVVQQGGSDPVQPWVLVFTSALQADEVAESLAFSIAPAHFHITVDHGQQDEGDFGLFLTSSPEGGRKAQTSDIAFEEDGFGLFAPPDTGRTAAALEDEGFGLFEPLPAAPANSEVLHEEDGFGLFAPLATATAPAAMLHEEEGFGLFLPLCATPSHTAPINSAASAAGQPAAPRVERAAPAAENSIRVNIDKVDLLLNLVGELVITQSMLLQSSQALDAVQNERLLSGISALQRNARELQEAVMSIRMTPIAFVFNRFPRVVRDLASKLGKQIELKMVGENTELDKGFIEKLADPLTHLVRNSLDHGIEAPDVRVAKGKSAVGRLTLRAFHQGGSIVIEVTDDGAGLHRERILAKARERGMPVSDSLSDSEVWGLIFEAGFSTAAEVTDVSGRGVGMDVVKRNIQGMGGRIDIDSMQDFGTTISIRLPLTLAIMDGMSVGIGTDLYVIPLSFVLESLQPQAQDLKTVVGKGQLVNVRGQYLPIVSLASFFGHADAANADPTRSILVIVEAGGQQLALLVDELIGQQQFVVKNLETNYRKVEGISGATIMGDGRVALILDISVIARHNQRSSPVAVRQAVGEVA
ncbi:signal transduction histidine kinase CheA [Aquitalea magnusonii]|uniref:Chemotaxis protein CheA n=1 Tax=Aquitalea magnusonii TaxID=332411 RepID=A0A3G9GJM9_9NEIS|nr:chemotaxis protein CheW [Aquitalea magnusonii]BBF86491.1 signal transduction histidine kinase CheA [Aquitalea magnusonii]